MNKANFDLRENYELAKKLKKYAESGDCPKELIMAAALRLERTTRHLEFWIKHYKQRIKRINV